MKSMLVKMEFTVRMYEAFVNKNSLMGQDDTLYQFMFNEALNLAKSMLCNLIQMMKQISMQDYPYYEDKLDFLEEVSQLVQKKGKRKECKKFLEQGVSWYMSHKREGTELMRETAINILQEYDILMAEQQEKETWKEVVSYAGN